MPIPLDTTGLPAVAAKILDGTAPLPLRQMAAKGIVPGLKPDGALTVLALLAESKDAELAAAATATFAKLPAPVLQGALGTELAPGLLDRLAPRYARDAAVMEKILAQPKLDSETVARVASIANEAVAELVAVNEQRLLAAPSIIEALYMNKETRMSTADRIVELAVRNGLELKGIPAFREVAQAIANELIAEPTEEPTPDDILFKEADQEAAAAPIDPSTEDTHRLDEDTGEEVVKERFQALHTKLAAMSITQKIRRAMLGSANERMILVRDKNKLVASASIRSPKIQENEVLQISSSRNVSDEVLRIIATNREWTQSHLIKLNLVTNPRTPFVFSSKLIGFLREHELKAIAKSKNVSGAIAQAARQQLNRKGK